MIKRATGFLRGIWDNKSVLYELAKRDYQQQYMGSYLGFIWVYLRPLLFIGVLYLVFTFGLRSGAVGGGVSFAVYLICGMIAWLFFAENFSAASDVIAQYSFLLKKVDFRLSILPIVKLLSASVPHLFFIVIAVAVAWLNGIAPSWYLLQIPYYFFAMFMLLLGLGWLTSSSKIFIKDVSNIVAILVQFGFWLTPVFWELSAIPERYQWIVKLNPAVYIVEGYRDAIIHKIGFWEKPLDALYFWCVAFFIMWIGISVFKRLRPHFAEVV
jgi:lipopolysaccharide transport system permease protein